jgi:glutamate carboxypeptidase
MPTCGRRRLAAWGYGSFHAVTASGERGESNGLGGPRILDALRARRSEMTSQLAELVACESPSADLDLLAKCASSVAALGQSLTGVGPREVEVDGRTHLLWRIGGDGAAPPEVVLVGHYDTVWPAGTLDRWPFSIDAEGRATGPGAFDMKAGIVQMFHALSVLDLSAQNGAGRGGGVAVLLTSDEELGSLTSRQLVEDTARGARAALILEPSAAGALKIARKGTSMYEIHVVGRSAHAGLEPDRGINATVELAHQILAVNTLGRPDAGTTVTPTVISAGTTTNTVPAAGVLHIDVRATDVAEQERVDAAIRRLTPALPGAELRIQGGINRPPLEAASSASLIPLADAVVARLGIEELRRVAVGGASDGNFTAGIGVPTLDGLGADGDKAHAEGEYVNLAAMPERAALVAGLLVELLGLSG